MDIKVNSWGKLVSKISLICRKSIILSISHSIGIVTIQDRTENVKEQKANNEKVEEEKRKIVIFQTD